MDHNQQQPPSQQPQQEVNRPPQITPLQFNDTQKQILQMLLQRTATSVLSFQFNEPENDQLRIRQHASLHGVMQSLTELLQYDAKIAADYEEQMRVMMDQETARKTGEDASLSEAGANF